MCILYYGVDIHTFTMSEWQRYRNKSKVQNLKLINILISESLKVNWIES